MPSRFPISAVSLASDPFCEDGFCVSDGGDPDLSPYEYWRATLFFTDCDDGNANDVGVPPQPITGPLVIEGETADIKLFTSWGLSTLITPTGSGDWVVNKQLNESEDYAGPGLCFSIGYKWVRSTPSIPLGLYVHLYNIYSTSAENQTRAPGMTGSIQLYRTLAAYNSNTPDFTWNGPGAPAPSATPFVPQSFSFTVPDTTSLLNPSSTPSAPLNAASSRFAVTSVPVVDDPFCSDDFCLGDPCVVTVNQGGDYVGQTYQIVGDTSVQWQADGSDITGAVGQTYTSVVSDIGKVITARAANGLVYNRCVGPNRYVGQDTEPALQYDVYLLVGGFYCKDPGPPLPPGIPTGGATSIRRTGTCAQSTLGYGIGRIDAFWPVNNVTNGQKVEVRANSTMVDPAGCLESLGCMPAGDSNCAVPVPEQGYPIGLVDVCDTTRYFTTAQFLDIRETPALWTQLGPNVEISTYIGQGTIPYLDSIVLVKYN